ncbi:MAG: PfaD family polyunsaturated fatty acid/polyketide biosynthesis protein [Candidatus Hydrogenedentes bacterium]|nr:PfaD family polyunsaturated fatty acid/polyketide biosynthesis protein [Candidatus Hydrogenedentota bacterium]
MALSSEKSLRSWIAPGIEGGTLPLLPGGRAMSWTNDVARACILQLNRPLYLSLRGGAWELLELSGVEPGDAAQPLPVHAQIPPIHPAQFGDPQFRGTHGLRYNYVTGAMANGIASEAVVEAMARAGGLGFFGAAGLSPERVERALKHLAASLGSLPYGFNLIHSPNEASHELAIADLYLAHGLHLVEASAYLDLTLAIVKYRVAGIHRDAAGRIVAPNRVVAKISRVEVATRFLSPPPEALLDELLRQGHITPEQKELARQIPMAEDLTAEADSGGHTDNRPAIALLPTIMALRDRLQQRFDYATPPRVGLAGGISTPASALAAFSMGAAFIMTGTVNQACVESGSSDLVRQMLAEAGQADVAMAPAADMFEMGVEVQVLKRGTMFSMRGARLYELYRSCGSLEEIPAAERAKLEKQFFRATLEETWQSTRAFFLERDPRQVTLAEADPKHKMALLFRSYLGQASRWANAGDASRKIDFQVWCGPAMGAFNEWVKGSFLEAPGERRIATVARNILFGAAVLQRAHLLRLQDVPVPHDLFTIVPKRAEELEELFA